MLGPRSTDVPRWATQSSGGRSNRHRPFHPCSGRCAGLDRVRRDLRFKGPFRTYDPVGEPQFWSARARKCSHRMSGGRRCPITQLSLRLMAARRPFGPPFGPQEAARQGVPLRVVKVIEPSPITGTAMGPMVARRRPAPLPCPEIVADETQDEMKCPKLVLPQRTQGLQGGPRPLGTPEGFGYR
jgi:hypothetical protein